MLAGLSLDDTSGHNMSQVASNSTAANPPGPYDGAIKPIRINAPMSLPPLTRENLAKHDDHHETQLWTDRVDDGYEAQFQHRVNGIKASMSTLGVVISDEVAIKIAMGWGHEGMGPMERFIQEINEPVREVVEQNVKNDFNVD